METSHLFRLSPELRNVIYTYVFASPYAVTLATNTIEHPLTKTCRQIRHETLSMYYNLTRFNAHLDDGPATPLANWLRTLGPELTLCIEQINIWDLHNLNGTLHGTDSTARLLRQTSPKYVLRPLSPGGAHSGFYLGETIGALNDMGLDLLRYCEVGDALLEEESQIKLTSELAIVELNEEM